MGSIVIIPSNVSLDQYIVQNFVSAKGSKLNQVNISVLNSLNELLTNNTNMYH